MTLLAVVVGAAIGAPLRYLLDAWITRRLAGTTSVREFPWGLFAVNVLGSAVAGVAFAFTTGDLRVFLITGFAGAFTTFSGHAWVTRRLWPQVRTDFWLSVVLTPAACVLAFLAAWGVA